MLFPDRRALFKTSGAGTADSTDVCVLVDTTDPTKVNLRPDPRRNHQHEPAAAHHVPLPGHAQRRVRRRATHNIRRLRQSRVRNSPRTTPRDGGSSWS